MAILDIYLKIETIPGYSPVEPDDHVSPPIQYRRDCMRNMGHEDGTVPDDEVAARRLTALIYREYLDPQYLVPKPDKLVAADVNEPAFTRRVPGTVIYARPGDWLRIHVKNGDVAPHSFHLHGVRYGIDSDGSWPFGTQSDDGRRSDEICPGQTWTYTFQVTDETVGAWPFHDHCRNIGSYVNRGLFGGLVVLSEKEHERLPRFPYPPDFEKHVQEVLKQLGRHEHPRRHPHAPAQVETMPMPMGRTMAMPMGGTMRPRVVDLIRDRSELPAKIITLGMSSQFHGDIGNRLRNVTVELHFSKPKLQLIVRGDHKHSIKALYGVISTVLEEILADSGECSEHLPNNHVQQQLAWLTPMLIFWRRVDGTRCTPDEFHGIVGSDGFALTMRKCKFRKPFYEVRHELVTSPRIQFITRANTGKRRNQTVASHSNL